VTIRIDKHPRGIAVAAPDGALRNDDLIRLAQALADRAVVSGDRVIAPLEAAGEIFAALQSRATSWDEDILQRARLQDAHRSMQLRARLEVARAMEDPHGALTEYRRLETLDPHQVDAVAALTVPSLRGLALFDEQGTGKTISALAAFEVLRERGTVKRLIVVAPKSVLGSWQEQSRQFLGDAFRVSLAAGSAAIRRRAILHPHDILLIGYESAVQDEALLRTILGAKSLAYMIIVDESFFVKNPETARARAVGRLRELCERAVVLCGTPAPNAPVDVVNQINIVDRGVAFSGRCIAKGDPSELQDVSRGLEESIVLRRLKEDVLSELGAKEFVKVYLELTGAQRALYDRARDELVVAVRSIDDRQFKRELASFLVKRVRLLQICSNPVSLDPLYDDTPAKLRALDRLLRELIDEQRKKVVLWSYFRTSLDAIVRRFSKYGVVRIDGSVASIDARISAVDRFQRDSDTRLFVGNAAAAGAGITLTAAHHAIYESFSNQAAHYMQSVDRIHRRGQTEQVVSHVLIARNTIEEAEYTRLLKKETQGRKLLGDAYSETMTRERFLTELEQ
jgi:SNF2 family DNA or RNA helicase